MGRKSSQAPGLGNALMKSRFKKNVAKATFVHPSESSEDSSKAYHKGYQNRGVDSETLESKTEMSTLEDFLATAKLADTDFTAERLNLRYVDINEKGLLSDVQEKKILQAEKEYQHLLSIPRRPKWDESTTKEDLDRLEKESFLDWRRSIAQIQEQDDLTVTPYEKNLDFWRQLWRVIERSSVIVQIVDARNPLLFRSFDLERYVLEVDSSKKNVILVNKADLLSRQQRDLWRDYFNAEGISALFWSAMLENEKLDNEGELTGDEVEDDTEDLLTRDELTKELKSLTPEGHASLVVGMVGYPNVGKSSTVNTLLSQKKVAVSATPGRTKHFQTLIIDDELCLCDCPGLVFPSFVSNKSDMILNGILPIDQMRDYVSPTNLLGTRISRNMIEATYGINLPRPAENEDPNRPPNAWDILNAHALSRGFMNTHGQPDASRSARIVLKDYVKGKLLFSVPPPEVDPNEYSSLNSFRLVTDKVAKKFHDKEVNETGEDEFDLSESIKLEKDFFSTREVGVFTKGRQPLGEKGNKKHHNRKKKEKMRRIRKVDN